MNLSDYGRNSSDHSRAETIVIINSVLNAPLILISIVGNALVLLAIFRTPSIHSTSMIMLTSLAFSDLSDLLVGLLAQPLFIAEEITSFTTQNPILYRVSAMIGFFCRWSVSWNNNSHQCGPRFGASLSHALRHHSDQHTSLKRG